MNRRHFILGSLAALAVGAGFSWPIYKSFGALPDQDFDSPNWANGYFHNLPDNALPWDLSHEPTHSGGWLKFFLSKDDSRYPPGPVESQKADLKNLADGEFVWLGHSSLIGNLNNKIFCIDPVLSHRASPVPFLVQAWDGSSPYAAEDFPKIDYLCITHDHWDHLDLNAIKNLDYRQVLCGKGVGSHFRAWGVTTPLHEMDWYERSSIHNPEFIFTPSQHFSGRGTTRNKTLWGGFIINGGEGKKIYFTGDGGYGKHFGQIGRKYGPFDLVFPDSGQYNAAWSHVHLFPEQSVQAVLDTGSHRACPVHTGRFTLSWHPWNEPRKRFASQAAKSGVHYIFPVIGEKFSIKS